MPPKSNSKISFQWQGTTADGKAASGTIEATDLVMARALLRRQGIRIKTIRRPSLLNVDLESLISGKAVKQKDIAAFSRQLATMINAGVSIMQAINVVIKGTHNKNLQALLRDIGADIETGSKFRDALMKHPKYFNSLYCSLIGVGEESGSLGIMIQRLADYQEKIESTKRKIRKAMFYPVTVLVISLGVAAVLLMKVVPQFQGVFAGFHAELPAYTQAVINLSNALRHYWFMFLAGIVAFIFSFRYAIKRFVSFKRWIDRMVLKLPIFGSLIKKSILARFARTLATTFSAGMPLVDALKNVAKTPDNLIYEEQILKVRDAVSTGRSLNSSLEETKLFPNEIVQMIGIGEETGELDNMLDKIAEIYEEEVDVIVDGLSSLLEPITIAFIGALIGGLVIAMYLPIFKLGSVV